MITCSVDHCSACAPHNVLFEVDVEVKGVPRRCTGVMEGTEARSQKVRRGGMGGGAAAWAKFAIPNDSGDSGPYTSFEILLLTAKGPSSRNHLGATQASHMRPHSPAPASPSSRPAPPSPRPAPPSPPPPTPPKTYDNKGRGKHVSPHTAGKGYK